jgi:sulfocyanin
VAPFLVALSCQRGDGAADGGGAADTAASAGAADGAAAPRAGAAETGGAAAETSAAGGASETGGGVGTAPGAGAAETGGAPAAGAAGDVDWMRVDEAAKRVEFDVVAGLTPTNGSWNFNGYANGDLTITVPVGWSVVMNFTNHDANVPHSVYVLDREPPFPQVMPEKPGIPRAYSINLMTGIAAGREDTLRFPVPTAGRYTMPCGVPGHAASGMWDWFVVSAEAERPSVSTKS